MFLERIIASFVTNGIGIISLDLGLKLKLVFVIRSNEVSIKLNSELSLLSKTMSITTLLSLKEGI
jgi:hypothetical protein